MLNVEPVRDYCAEYTDKIKQSLYRLAKEYCFIGFLLDEMVRYGYYQTGGYANIYEYGFVEFGFKKSSVNNFLNIYREFCYGIDSSPECRHGFRIIHAAYELKADYASFKYSQLCEMLSLSEKQRREITPDMTVQQIRKYKQGDSGDFQTSGKEKPFVLGSVKEVYPLEDDKPDELYALLSKSHGLKVAVVFYE